jgi:hypothetical protein
MFGQPEPPIRPLLCATRQINRPSYRVPRILIGPHTYKIKN